MNVWDFVLGAAIIALLVLAIWLMARSRAKGGCAGCPHAKACNELRDRPAIRLQSDSAIYNCETNGAS